jgi:hypothetical protein
MLYEIQQMRAREARMAAAAARTSDLQTEAAEINRVARNEELRMVMIIFCADVIETPDKKI